MEDNHMSMKEHINYAFTKLSFSFSSSRVTPYSGLLIPGQMLSAIGFDRKVDMYTPPVKEYSNSGRVCSDLCVYRDGRIPSCLRAARREAALPERHARLPYGSAAACPAGYRPAAPVPSGFRQ